MLTCHLRCCAGASRVLVLIVKQNTETSMAKSRIMHCLIILIVTTNYELKLARTHIHSDMGQTFTGTECRSCW